MCSLPTHCVVLLFCFLQVNGSYIAQELEMNKSSPLLEAWVPDSLHCVQFILVDINIMPKVCLLATQRHFRGVRYGMGTVTSGYTQQLTAGTGTKQSQEWAVWLKLTSANKSLFHAAATEYVWFTLQWTSERDLCQNKAMVPATTFITGTAKRRASHCNYLGQPQM